MSATIDHARTAELERQYDSELDFRSLLPPMRQVGSVVLVLLSLYHYYTAGFGLLPEHWHNSIHLSAVLALIYLWFDAGVPLGPRIGGVPIPDLALAACSVVSVLYLPVNFDQLTFRIGVPNGWDLVMGTALIVLILEATRRSMGIVLPIIVVVFIVYGLFGNHVPGVLAHPGATFENFVSQLYMTQEGIFGIPVKVVATFVFHFVLFGTIATKMGLGKFFIDLATVAAGRYPGGPAKVAVVSSALFGMLSGSPTSNVLTTGTLTIPTMKRCGYPAHYAGAVEACASTGGALMPPVMGAAAFIMASFLNVPYAEVVVAATLPSFLYYLALFVQTDLYAVRHRLHGVGREEIPPLRPTLLGGWYYFGAIVGLTVLLIVYRIEAEAPFWVSLFLLGVAVLRRRATGFGWIAFARLVVESGEAVARLVALIAGIGLVIGGMSMTGVANSFSRELVQYAGGNIALLLFFGALTSFVLGMGMTSSACYIFLAIVLAPALVASGLDPMASHLYVLYWGLVSFITPPVALAAIAAAFVAKASPMRTAMTSLRIGILLMLLPVFFVLQPALILHGETATILRATATASVAIILLAAATEGHLYGFGTLPVWARIMVGAGALLMLAPEPVTDLVGLGIVAATIVAARLMRSG